MRPSDPTNEMQIFCKAALFDLDGTLVDSAGAVRRIWSRFAEHHGINIDFVMRVAKGRRAEDTIRFVAPRLNASELGRRLDRLAQHDVANVVVTPGAAQLLRSIPPSRCAIVTSSTRQMAESRLAAAGLPRPRLIIGAGEVPHGKPDPSGYHLAAATMGVEVTSCLAFEDSEPGISAAIGAGMSAVLVGCTGDVPPADPKIAVVGSLADLSASSTDAGIIVQTCIRPAGIRDDSWSIAQCRR